MTKQLIETWTLIDVWNGGNGGLSVKCVGTENECFRWVHNHTSFSFDWALKHGGYKMVKTLTPAKK